jgi:hypothetical protein
VTRTEIAAIALSLFAAATAFFAAMEARRASSGLAALSERLAKAEPATSAGAPVSPAGPTNSDLSREIVALRSQLAALQAHSAPAATESAVKTAADPAAAAAAAKKAHEAEEARQQVWLEATGARIVETLAQHLGLTAQQETQVKEVISGQMVTFRAARLSKSGEDTKKAVEDLTADTNAKVKVLLTPEQQAKYDEIANRAGGIFAIPGTYGAVRLNGGTSELVPAK